jgi:2-amino-4-hydroxy-6-hydroxymethyldihydropteridine diphosphokinase
VSKTQKNIKRAYIAFGANLSNPRATLMAVIRSLAENGIIIDRVSNLWRSRAWPPGSNAPDYQNAVLSVRTALAAGDLMQLLLHTEKALGRIRTVANAPRSCDLDLIDFDGQMSDDPDCILPHPRMHQRDFVLLPLDEVADTDWRHPVNDKDIQTLLSELGASRAP